LSPYRAIVATTWSEKHRITWNGPEIAVTLHQKSETNKKNKVMKTKKNLVKAMLMSILTAGMMTHNNPTPNAQAERTVLVYLAGHNDLSGCLERNIRQLKDGSRRMGSGTLLVFVRTKDSGRTPWVARIENGQVKDSVSVKDLNINVSGNYACDPDMMGQVMQYAFKKYPAKEYGLVLGGHSTGWIIEEEPNSVNTRAFGHDTGDYIYGATKWLNIPTMARLLEQGPHLTFIFADCCNFMCLESMYELRNTTDYIIGAPTEIPGEGAPYEEVVPAFFEKTTFATTIVDKYYAAQEGFLPLSVVKTSQMEQLASATRTAIDAVQAKIGNGYADTKGLIHYNYSGSNASHHQEYNIFYDAGDFFRSQLSDSEYQQWKQALDKAVVEKRFAQKWATCLTWRYCYSDFEMTQEKFHGVSMFVPQNPTGEYGKYYAKYNKDIEQLQWYQAVGW